MSALTSIRHCTGNFSSGIRQKEELKAIQTGKEEVYLSLFTDGIIIYVENPIESTKWIQKIKVSLVTLLDTKSVQEKINCIYTCTLVTIRN